ncbi:RagB/SusD family nutrient uptake outer membrane protein [Zobellia galactanivorans]|uniref:SusD/RagB family lipoprotein n=1 Tax=Zobellia galactanivorans (strain DSM 12802 / CCUG 47099 / CIP 106680 / NCIMB 13871 / Dsij) TaxID=63186 RepID=G0LAT5_ZOBGA|nr:RagB/SusD family nutrient uptake outer membrane protein [Zobellia galactanivorans]MBU3027990.1 RagB/SusD family nutrient uptake outer membrane protein [Zobellia galactanivorans]MDO6808269.1 RagB/SusD family nutrient uptake outer membrane protein [Zobellia galactanivorans]CAZ95546.1 SusD/RagB family lipoprotein [Zobellia galactanivorans]
MKYLHNITYLKAACLLLISISFSCDSEEFLENENKSKLTDQTQWQTEGNADIFVNDVYSEIPRICTLAEQLDYYTDDYNISHYYTASNWRQGICQAPGSSNASPWGGTYGPTNGYTWESFFVKVRKCNTGLKELEANKDNFTPEYYNQRTDELRFLRAYFYSEFFMHIGGLPILTEPLDRNTMTEEELLTPRATFEETFNFIVNELGSIVDNGHLEIKYNSGDQNAGRATLGAALALKGWIELFGASPLFNSGSGYLPDTGNFVHFATADPNRWATAAATNKKFIDEYEGIYDLFDDLPNLWRASNEYNSEVIWDRQIVANIGGMGSNYERRGGPTYVLDQYMTWGNYNPTQEVVDQFAMANGKPISDPTSGYDPQNPYENREKRFYDFIVYDGAPYKLDWMPEEDTIYTRIDEAGINLNQIDLAGSNDVGDSGYYQKKRLNPDAAPGNDASGQNDLFYRYAEVLLNYAEAQNEAVGPDQTVYDAINKIRNRSDLPDLPAGLSQDEMRDAIHTERRVELCFENKRYYDNKRWMQQEETMGVARHNMVIRNTVPSDNSGVWTYSVEPEVKFTPKFEARQYMSPIPQNVIDQNPNISQNPGY